MKKHEKIRLTAILIISILVIITGSLFSYQAFANGDIGGAILGGIVALVILTFALIVYSRGRQDLKKGMPLHDERSRKVMEKASSKAFYISLYVLLAIGFLSDKSLHFRDASQALGISVGCMALLFAGFWAYYNRQPM